MVSLKKKNPKQNLFKKINALFGTVFVLSAPGASQRRKHICSHLFGLDFEFHIGVDKEYMKLNLKNPNSLSQTQKSGELLDNNYLSNYTWNFYGMAACSEGHKQIYPKIIDRNAPCLIMEDDVVLKEDKIGFLLRALDNLPQSWDLIYFGYTGGIVENPKYFYFIRKFIYYVKVIIRYYSRFTLIPAVPVNKYFDKASLHAGCYAYALNPKAAEKLYSLQKNLKFTADGSLQQLIKNNEVEAYILSDAAFCDATYFKTKVFLPSIINS